MKILNVVLKCDVPGCPPPSEIVQAVLQDSVPPLRPSLCFHSHSEELGVLMQRCWSEEPGERPDFNTIKILLSKQHRWGGGHYLVEEQLLPCSTDKYQHVLFLCVTAVTTE